MTFHLLKTAYFYDIICLQDKDAEERKLYKESKFLIYRFLRAVGSPVFRFIFRPEIAGAENIPQNGAVIIAGNHKHALDPILIDISTKRIVRTLAKKELHDGPFGFIFRSTGTIPVDLHSSRNKAALESAVEVLINGGTINLSPEAKRNFTNELLLPFKYGAVAMSRRTNTPIVPYSVTGDYRLFSKNLKVTFGRAFYPDTSSDDLYNANRELYEKILELLTENTDKKVLETKHITSFDEWEKKNSR